MAEMDSLEYQILAAYTQQRAVRSSPKILMPMFHYQGLEEKVEEQGRWLEKPAWKQGVVQVQGPLSPPCKTPKWLLSGESLRFEDRNLEDDEEEEEGGFQGLSSEGLTVEKMELKATGAASCHRGLFLQGLTSGSSVPGAASPEAEPAAAIANRLAEIVQAQPQQDSFEKVVLQSTLESQNTVRKENEDQIIMKIAELLKYSGDQLQQELKKDNTLQHMFWKLNYSIFKSIVDRFLRGLNIWGEPEEGTQRTRLAFAVDVIARLSAVDNCPMNRVLGFGTKYLQKNFTPWIQQHGGWEKVMGVAHGNEVE
ncbi:apoptosis facilitator Bcl-2-like protein 14 isoform X1 [Ornithorhynchus anatinus]|uniref:apoptosis facilitator Bcl-2-like protein 14 isoform X1 n=1 Tax=Ornithorhynchus anatinus TaxID=9258 RepID=UPI0010A77A2B|nr:apoptosis facilitator Bcl-2-like protein 14 isoform X1 [Ornithorhynchus anatinus]